MLILIVEEHFGIHIAIICFFVVLVPVLGYLCHHNHFVKDTLYKGWLPVILAMLISR